MNTIIVAKDISKSFKNKSVLKSLSVEVSAGSVYGFLGKNGSGKTTLIKCLLGLLRADNGQSTLFEESSWDLSETTKAKIGYVPQRLVLYPWLKVKETISYVASFYPVWDQRLIEQLTEEWELDPEANTGKLSEGQTQKLGILLALGHRPELLVFDEPVASLDPAARRQFLKAIVELLADQRCTVFFSTHITSDLERIADHVGILKEGALAYSGELDALKEGVKRLRIKGLKSPLSKTDVPGLLHQETTEDESLISLRDYRPALKETLEKKYNAQVEIQDLNLEDIFLEVCHDKTL